MDHILERATVKRVAQVLLDSGIDGAVHALTDSARTAQAAAEALGVEVGQIASSLIFTLPDGTPLLIITSGRHRVDTELVAATLNVEKLGAVDANYVKAISGFSIGGVSPFGWVTDGVMTLIDVALGDYETIWAAAGHPHAVFPCTYSDLIRVTGAQEMIVSTQ